MPRAWWFVILMGQASAVMHSSINTPACTMDYFGFCGVGPMKITYLPEPSTSQTCFDTCLQKLDSWSVSDWYYETGMPIANDDWWSCGGGKKLGPATPPNQAKPERLMLAEWMVPWDNVPSAADCTNNWSGPGEECNVCGCWCAQ